MKHRFSEILCKLEAGYCVRDFTKYIAYQINFTVYYNPNKTNKNVLKKLTKHKSLFTFHVMDIIRN